MESFQDTETQRKMVDLKSQLLKITSEQFKNEIHKNSRKSVLVDPRLHLRKNSN